MSESPEDFRSPKTSAKITTVKSEIGRVSRFSVNPDWYVGVNRKISVFEWIMIVTAPIVNPIIGVFLIAFAIKHLNQKKISDTPQNTSQISGLVCKDKTHVIPVRAQDDPTNVLCPDLGTE